MVDNIEKTTIKNQKYKVKGRSKKNSKQINSKTRYDFSGSEITPYGGLFPLATMLEKLQFQELIEEKITVKRHTRSMSKYQYILSILLGLYIGFDRLSHLIHIAFDPIVTGILKVTKLAVQSSFWRFLKSLGIFNVKQFKKVNNEMLKRVWESANITLTQVTLDTDTTVNTIYGNQQGGRKGYNPTHKGKKSYQPIFTFIAETGEYISGSQRKGNTISGIEIYKHLKEAFKSLPKSILKVRSRADAGFYCKEAIDIHDEYQYEFIIVAHKTSSMMEILENADWKNAKDTDGVTSFNYQPMRWTKKERFVAARYKKIFKEGDQLEFFESDKYTYRVMVTNMKGRPAKLIKFYDGRAAAENLIKEANNDAGVASVPTSDFVSNMNFFQLSMLAYNFNRWLMLFSLEKGDSYKRTMLSTARLKFVFIAAKIVRHAKKTTVKFSEKYHDKNKFDLLMKRLRNIRKKDDIFLPVFTRAFCCQI